MKILSCFIALCLGFVCQVVAQQNLSGVVVDEKMIPLEFCNVVLQNASDSSFVSGGVTQEDGIFELEAQEGSYLLTVSSIGYQEYTVAVELGNEDVQLEKIKMQLWANDLDMVVVKGRKAIIERKIDRLVFNISTSIVAGNGNLLGALKIVPGVLVDAGNSISIAGKSGVRIMIDDKPVQLSGSQLAGYLKSIPASSVDKIEVITNPSAKYEAEGTAGIINIRLKKNRSNGVNGTVYTKFSQGMFSNYGIGGNINYKRNKLSMFLNYDYSYDVGLSDGKEIREFTQAAEPLKFSQYYYDRTNYDNQLLRTGLEYDINDQQVIGFSIDGTLTQVANPYDALVKVQDAKGTIDSVFNTRNNLENDFKNVNANLSYDIELDTAGRSFSAKYDYSFYQDERMSNFETDFFDGNGQALRAAQKFRLNNPTKLNIQALKLDYTQPLDANTIWDMGAKGSMVVSDNVIRYDRIENENPIFDTARSNIFDYQESYLGLYTNLKRTINKWDFQLGLRLEYTDTEGESEGQQIVDRAYWQLFPSVFVQRTINEDNQVNFSYSRRISRPDYSSLNPFEFYFDPYSFTTGNPLLRPEIGNSFELSYTFKSRFTGAISYLRSTDVISEISSQNDDSRILAYTNMNLRLKNNYGVNVSIPLDIKKWWSVYGYFGWFHNEYDSEINGEAFNSKKSSFNLYVANDFQLPKGITAEITAFYLSPFVDGISEYRSLANISLGVQKSFLNDKLDVKIGATDLFRTNRERVRTQFANQDIYLSQFHDYRKVNLSLTYRFSKGSKINRKDFDSGNDDEKNRVSFE